MTEAATRIPSSSENAIKVFSINRRMDSGAKQRNPSDDLRHATNPESTRKSAIKQPTQTSPDRPPKAQTPQSAPFQQAKCNRCASVQKSKNQSKADRAQQAIRHVGSRDADSNLRINRVSRGG